jgi:DNA-binding transcriptional LysR family regulator
MHNPFNMLVFAKVVGLNSLTARRPGISRSAASKRITRLEQALGARLLSRTTRKLSLTEPGHAAYPHCARIATKVENICHVAGPQVGRARQSPAGDRSCAQRPARRPGGGNVLTGTAVSRWVLPTKKGAEGGSLAQKRRDRGRTG